MMKPPSLPSLLRGAAALALLAGCGAALGCASSGPGLATPDTSTPEGMLTNKDFRGLDALAVAYRRPDSVKSDGLPNLPAFYSALTSVGDETGNPCSSSLDKGPWAQRRQLLQQWRRGSGDPRVPELVLALLDLAEGRKARGGGYAYTVTDEGRARYQARTASARARLGKLGALAKIDPQWYEAMMDVALAQGWERERFAALFERATTAFPDYAPLYFNAAQYYGPKWHGRPGDFDALVEKAVAKTSRRLGQTMYARLHWVDAHDGMFTDGSTDWPRMRSGFDAMMKDFPDAWNRNNFARFACQARDMKTAREQLRIIGPAVSLSAWRGRSYLDDCRAAIAASTM